jgi:hypothetical protein
VSEVQSVPGEDRCVLLLGYEHEMKEMFQRINPGLSRRFPLSNAFHFHDFDDSELLDILKLKLQQQGLGASPPALIVAIQALSRARNALNFGNGGSVENLLATAKSNYEKHHPGQNISQTPVPQAPAPMGLGGSIFAGLSSGSGISTTRAPVTSNTGAFDYIFGPEDFDPDWDQAARKAGTNLQELFKDVVGCDDMIDKLNGYIEVVRGMKVQGRNPLDHIPMSFVFKGPPGMFHIDFQELFSPLIGTGKTTTARKFGQVFYDLGLLSSTEVIESSAEDLIGSFVGQTATKTIRRLEKGLGKVLLIDEAYMLCQNGFGTQAIGQLVDCMTQPRFHGKLVIILSGYEDDMNNLLGMNQGLAGRFTEDFMFLPLRPETCLKILVLKLKNDNMIIPSASPLRTRYKDLLERMTTLCQIPRWSNTRDVETLAKDMARSVFQTHTTRVTQLEVTSTIALKCMERMISAHQARANSAL